LLIASGTEPVTLTIAVNSMSGQSLVVLLVTNSVEQSPRQKANSSTPSQEVSLYAFMEPEGSLPYSQKPGTGLYSEPDVSSPQLPTIFF